MSYSDFKAAAVRLLERFAQTPRSLPVARELVPNRTSRRRTQPHKAAALAMKIIFRSRSRTRPINSVSTATHVLITPLLVPGV